MLFCDECRMTNKLLITNKKETAIMIKNYLKIAWRNLSRNKIFSLINVGGLAVGMGVAILIALWVYDELSFDQYHPNYRRIAQVMQHQTFNGQIATQEANPAQMAEEIVARPT